jgi:hypothetical protein
MVHETSTQPPRIIIGHKLKAQLRKEAHELLDQWNFVSASRRREITRRLMAIFELLGEDRDNG